MARQPVPPSLGGSHERALKPQRAVIRGAPLSRRMSPLRVFCEVRAIGAARVQLRGSFCELVRGREIADSGRRLEALGGGKAGSYGAKKNSGKPASATWSAESLGHASAEARVTRIPKSSTFTTS